MAHEAGKGDKRRPEDKTAYDQGYDRIFGKKAVETVLNNEVPLSLRDWSYEERMEKLYKAEARAVIEVAKFYNLTEEVVKELYMDEVRAWKSLQDKGVV